MYTNYWLCTRASPVPKLSVSPFMWCWRIRANRVTESYSSLQIREIELKNVNPHIYSRQLYFRRECNTQLKTTLQDIRPTMLDSYSGS